MAITSALATQYKVRVMQGVYNTTSDVYMVALYTSSATLGAGTTSYTSVNECSGGNYPAGGIVMPGATVVQDTTTAILTFSNPTFINLTLPDVHGCMIYNATHTDDCVAVFDFGQSISLFTSNFTLIVPGPTATTGLIRIN